MQIAVRREHCKSVSRAERKRGIKIDLMIKKAQEFSAFSKGKTVLRTSIELGEEIFKSESILTLSKSRKLYSIYRHSQSFAALNVM